MMRQSGPHLYPSVENGCRFIVSRNGRKRTFDFQIGKKRSVGNGSLGSALWEKTLFSISYTVYTSTTLIQQKITSIIF